MAMYCFSHCFLYSRTECIMKYGAERKFYPKFYHSLFFWDDELQLDSHSWILKQFDISSGPCQS